MFRIHVSVYQCETMVVHLKITFQSGRKTPTDLRGRKTPTNLDGRKTPTEKSPFGRKGEKEIKAEPAKKEASILDFLTEDQSTSRKKKTEEPKRRLLSQPTEEAPEREESIRDDILGDKIKRARQRQAERETSGGGTKLGKEKDQDKIIPDDSSLCEELERDPLGRSFADPVKESK